MIQDNFDKELEQLYQQRKANVDTPEFSLKPNNTTISNKSYSWLSKSAIFFVGGLASFGILAIVSFLAKSPVEKPALPSVTHQGVIIKDVIIEENTEKSVVVKAPLPPIPDVPTRAINDKSIAHASGITPINNTLNFNVNQAIAVILPAIKQPELAPIAHYKVAPIYPESEINKGQAGSIKLTYQIDEAGKVYNIVVLESNVNKILQRAAKKALRQWQYSPEQVLTENYQVVFDFQLPKSANE